MLQLAIISLLIFIVIYCLIYYSSIRPSLEGSLTRTKNVMPMFCVLMAFAFVLRFVISSAIEGFSTDINCFKAWSDMAYKDGLSNFYTSGTFADYPPGYIYVLYMLGFLRDIFNIEYSSNVFTVMIKMPAVLCDLLAGAVIYKAAMENKDTKKFALPLSALYLLNPAVIVNSSAWGQVDSIYSLMVVLFMYFLYKNKVVLSAAIFTVGFMIKPQTVMFAPVVIAYFVYRLISEKDKRILFKQSAQCLLMVLVIVFAATLPFVKNFDFAPVINQYADTIKSYPYASVNAYNLFMLFGGNWADISDSFIFLSFGVWSDIFIVLITVAAIFVYIRSKGEKSYYEIGAFIIIALFTLAGKMHERYVFSGMLLLIMAFIKKRDKRYLFSYIALSVTQMLNVSIVLSRNIELNTTSMPEGSVPYIIAAANIAILIYVIKILIKDMPQAEKTKNSVLGKKEIKSFYLKKSEKAVKLVKIDFIVMAVVTLLYSVVAFINLGDMKAAETHSFIPAGTTVTLRTNGTDVNSVKWYTGYTEERKIDIYCDGEMVQGRDSGEVFSWNEETTVAKNAVEIYFYSDTDIIEMAFFDKDGNYVNVAAESDNNTDLSNFFDEKALVPKSISYKNSTYFDEIYHARTAYEHIHGLDPYEDTHPPLGKLIIAIGILIFGMNPFGWRFSGTVFGIIMLPVIYIFAKWIFKNTKAASVTIILFALDFMHFAQTRIATIDVYVTLFIMLMFMFMYKYTSMSFYDTPLIKTFVPLGLSGLFFGLAVASKWTGLYGGAGLCVIFFITLTARIYEYYKVKKSKTSTDEQRKAVLVMPRYTAFTLLFCVVMFVIVPVLIYCASYIPYLRAPGMEGIKSIVKNQISMFDYHSNLEAAHPFSSLWYEWPAMIRPVWYYSNEISETVRQTIVSFGNPAVWWLGIATLAFVFVNAIKKREKNSIFIALGFLAQLLPWVGVSRCIFLYHYFPAVPFLILSIGYAYNYLRCADDGLNEDRVDIGAVVYLIIAMVLFVLFYPAISGLTVPDVYLDMLKWLPKWVF